jgi:hypothetical protein
MPRTNYYALLDLRQLAPDLLVRRPLFVIHFDKFPTDDALRIDDESRRMRPAAAVRIKDTVAVDHFVIFIFEQRKIELAVEAFAEHFAEFFRLLVIIGADREDLHFFLL